MTPWAATLRNYAELARVSNLPTCVSNVFVGCAIGAKWFGWPTALLIATPICLLYIGGMTLNDAVDVEIDRKERPGRPIPSGRVRLRTAYALANAAFAAGLGILALFGLYAFTFGVALVAAIVLYDLLHKRYSWTAALMGVCRGLVYLVAAAAIAWPFDLRRGFWLAGILGAYTVGITVVAQSENQQQIDARRWIAVAMPILVLGAATLARPQQWARAALLGAVMTAWLARAVEAVFRIPPRTKKAVLTWLSGMCLVDMYLLFLLNRPMLSLVPLLCFAATLNLHRRIMGT
jgi:UbiA prenyltransferase family protein